MHSDLRQPGVVGLATVNGLPDHLGGGCLRMGFQGPGALLQSVGTLKVKSIGVGAKGRAGHHKTPVGCRHVPGHSRSMTQDRHPMANNPRWVVLSHEHSAVFGESSRQASTSVSYRRSRHVAGTPISALHR